MEKRWAAGALAALSLFWAVSASPLADARGRTAVIMDKEPVPAEPAPPAAETQTESGEAPTEDFAASLKALRATVVEGVPAESLDAARYAVFRGLLSPGERGGLKAEEPVTRGEAVSALYRLSGELVQADGCRYTDVPEEIQDAVVWASSAGISGGVSEDRFAPNGPVTRSQLAVMLHRFAAWRGDSVESKLAVSWNGESVPAYAEEAVNWVLERRLYAGMTDHGLYPSLPVSHLQFAEILVRLQRDQDPLAAALILPEGESVSLSQQRHEAIHRTVEQAARRHGAVGVQVAVIERGAVTDTYQYGWAVKGTAPMTSRHKMRTASLSKVAVGIAAALLREEGTVDYDADIGLYWDQNARNPRHPDKPVTIRTILTHTSTLLNSESIAWDYAGVRAQLGTSSGYGGGTPGSLKNWSYNNHAFGILGQTLELASGRYLDDVLEERLLTPLGADCAFAAGELEQPELVTPLYRTSSLGRSAENQRSVLRWSAPGVTGRQFAGGFTSSALDMAKLVAVLAGDGCFEGVRLMDAGTVEEMESHSWQALPGGSYQALPMRFRPDLYGRESLYYHTGSAYGVYNLLSYDPASGDGVVVLTMGADGGKDAYDIYSICGEISRSVYNAIK